MAKKKNRDIDQLMLTQRITLVKSSPLSTGAVIVDLPGVHDSNAARAAVADGYSELWIPCFIRLLNIEKSYRSRLASCRLGPCFKGAVQNLEMLC